MNIYCTLFIKRLKSWLVLNYGLIYMYRWHDAGDRFVPTFNCVQRAVV